MKHLKTTNLEGKRDRSSAYVKDEDGVLLRDVELIRERWVRWFNTFLNAKSPRLSERTESPLSCSRSPSMVIPPHAGDSSISSFVFRGGARCRSSGKMPSSWYSTKRRIGRSAATTGASRWERTPARYYWKSSLTASASTVSAWGSCRGNRVGSDRTVLPPI